MFKIIFTSNGNLINDGKQIYIYDYKNRLVKVNSYETDRKGKISTNLVAEFSYDILGRRTSKTTYNDEDEIKKIVRYTYSNQDIIQEDTYGIRDGKEKLKDTKEYVYGKGIDDVVVMILITPYLSSGASPVSSGAKSKDLLKTNSSIYFYQKDQLGSIIVITDKDGKTVKEYRYDVFGKAYERNTHGDKWNEYRRQDIDNTRLFTGREFDREIGLYYYRARYYSADLGRFISRDPIGQVDDINLYSYVGNNPVGFVDPFGREKSLIDKIQLGVQDITTFIGLNITGIGGEGAQLKVSSYMLAKFMYGNGSSDYYGTNHWISQKVMQTDFYKKELGNATNSVIKNGEYERTITGDIGDGVFSDFPTSFGTVNLTMTARKLEDGQIETNFNIKDTYIFNDLYGDGTVIENPFNVFAKYYQDRGYGTPFNWELNITQVFNY